jgi:hypothetical protein
MPDPNIVDSGFSQRITVDGHDLKIEIYRREHDTQWSLEVVDEYGTSTVWDDLFDTDQGALDAALKVVNEEGLSGFRDSENVVPFLKH